MARGKHAASAVKRRVAAESEVIIELQKQHDEEIKSLLGEIETLKGEIREKGRRYIHEADPIVAEAVGQATAALRHELEKTQAGLDAVRSIITNRQIPLPIEAFQELTVVFGKGWLDNNRKSRRTKSRGLTHHLRQV